MRDTREKEQEPRSIPYLYQFCFNVQKTPANRGQRHLSLALCLACFDEEAKDKNCLAVLYFRLNPQSDKKVLFPTLGRWSVSISDWLDVDDKNR